MIRAVNQIGVSAEGRRTNSPIPEFIRLFEAVIETAKTLLNADKKSCLSALSLNKRNSLTMQKYETFCKTTRFSKDFFAFVGKLSIDATRIFQFTDTDMPNNQRFTRHDFLLLREIHFNIFVFFSPIHPSQNLLNINVLKKFC